MLFKSCHHVIIFFSCCEMRDEKEELIPGDSNGDNGNSSAQSSSCRMHFPILQKFETLELLFHSLPGTEDCLGSKTSQTANEQMQLHLTMLYIPQDVRNHFKSLLSDTPRAYKSLPKCNSLFNRESFILTKCLPFKDTHPSHKSPK